MQKTKKLLTIGITAIVLVSILALMPAPSSAVTRIVPSLAYPTIQAAITAAGSGDTVQVLAGTYAPSTSHEVFPINMRDGVSLLGAGADITILDAEGANSVVSFSNINDTTTTIDGFTIRNGSAFFGGGMYISYSSPTVTNCIFTGNQADAYGGGMYNEQSSPNVTNCIFTGNSAVWGSGGGMYNYQSSPTVTNCIFTGNSAYYDGGGMSNLNNSSPTRVTNCTFSGNSAVWGSGGGMYNYQSSPTVTNCILWGNGDEIEGAVNAAYSDIEGWISNDNDPDNDGYDVYMNFSADPLFVDPNNGYYHLGSGSPCKDRGTIAGAPPYDYDGVPRPQGPAPDVGAYELIYVKLDTNPSGLKIYVDPDPTPQYLTAPQYFYFVYDSTHTLGVETPQYIGPIEYSFNQWGDGRDITVRTETFNLFLITENMSIFQANFRGPALNNPPVAQCQDNEVALDADGKATISASDVDNGSYDPDEGDTITLSIDITEFTCADVGAKSVTLTVTDNNGNSSTATATVTVEDMIRPEIDMDVPQTITPPDAPISFTATATDNCEVSVEITEYDCFKFTKKGKRVDKTQSCVVQVNGATITIMDSGGVGTRITWTVTAVDSGGTTTTETFGLLVVNPGKGKGKE